MSAAEPRSRSSHRQDVLQPALAGVVAALVGFASTFTVVLAGLRAVGATESQAASGLLAVSVLMGGLAIFLGWRLRMPIGLAWSTPAAALLASASVQDGGFAAAVGAFVVCGLLIVLAGLWRTLGRWIAAIPAALANAMLAGVLLPLCLAPVRSVVELPLLTAPVIITWVLLTRIDRRWSVPAALVVAAIAIAIDRPLNMGLDDLAPQLTFTVPELHVRAIIGLAIPLFVVTMASQNIPGVSVLATYGCRPDLRPLLTTTGAATMVGAPFGAHTVSLAAITAAMVAGPAVHADPARRWIASVTSGAIHVVLGLCAGAATVLIAAAPPVLIECVAGLALLGALGAALTTALADAERREAAMVTFVISASGMTALGIGGSFWGLVAGLAFLALHRTGRRDRETSVSMPANQRYVD